MSEIGGEKDGSGIGNENGGGKGEKGRKRGMGVARDKIGRQRETGTKERIGK